MKTSSMLVLACWSYLVCFSSASADWQYTRWGMTLDEVIAAADGKAKKYTDSGQDTENESYAQLLLMSLAILCLKLVSVLTVRAIHSVK